MWGPRAPTTTHTIDGQSSHGSRMQSVDAAFAEPLQCLFEPRQYKVLFGGRGAGRSWGCARALLLIGSQRKIRVLCARELQKSIDDSVHKVLSDQIHELGLDGFYTIFKHAITSKNGTSFVFEGIKNNTNKIRSLEGIDYCWIEEAAKMSKASWDIIDPTIRKSKSEIWLTFNPELDEDFAYKKFVRDLALRETRRFSTGAIRWESSDTIVVKMTWADNPWFHQTSLVAKKDKSEREDPDGFLNIWQGHTIQNLEGAVYAKELRRAAAENRICSVPYERQQPVDVFFDLGRADNTAMWFVQRVGMQWRVLKYFEESGPDWPYFLKIVQNSEYVIGTIFLPHDGKAKRLGSKLSIEELTRQAGFRVQIVPKQSRSDGINAAKIVMKNCWFDSEKCEDGLWALRHYRYKITDGQLSNEPLHDEASDGADAFRYFAMSSKAPRESVDSRARGLRKQINLMIERAPGLGWMG